MNVLVLQATALVASFHLEASRPVLIGMELDSCPALPSLACLVSRQILSQEESPPKGSGEPGVLAHSCNHSTLRSQGGQIA